MSIFGKNKNAIVFTNLIVKVRKNENQKPYFSFHDQPAISDETKASADFTRTIIRNTQCVRSSWLFCW